MPQARHGKQLNKSSPRHPVGVFRVRWLLSTGSKFRRCVNQLTTATEEGWMECTGGGFSMATASNSRPCGYFLIHRQKWSRYIMLACVQVCMLALYSHIYTDNVHMHRNICDHLLNMQLTCTDSCTLHTYS